MVVLTVGGLISAGAWHYWRNLKRQSMRSFIRRLSPRGEFILVMLVGFGPIITFQLLSLLQPARSGGSAGPAVSNAALVAGVIGALALLAAVLRIGKLRGWSLATLGFRVSWRGAAAGVLLFVVAQLAESGAGRSVQAVHPQPNNLDVAGTVAGIALPVILLSALVIPILEEVLEAGYMIHSLQSFGLWPAVLASASLRALIHWQQGINAALMIFVWSLILALAYWRWRRLFPLVVAHALTILYAVWYVSRRAA